MVWAPASAPGAPTVQPCTPTDYHGLDHAGEGVVKGVGVVRTQPASSSRQRLTLA
ncbi:hypothetical protein P3342_009474 [Pyrenophora teres f. teres]|nr:hypothetical protein P3342_009474 [Pyrenophora teres f. teres]